MASFMVEHGLQSTQALIVAIFRLSCPKACGILVPEPRIEPVWPTSAGGFLAPGSGKSNLWVSERLFFTSQSPQGRATLQPALITDY